MKDHQLSLAVTLAALLGSSAIAQAQEVPEVDTVEPETSEASVAQQSVPVEPPIATIEVPTTTVEFSPKETIVEQPVAYEASATVPAPIVPDATVPETTPEVVVKAEPVLESEPELATQPQPVSEATVAIASPPEPVPVSAPAGLRESLVASTPAIAAVEATPQMEFSTPAKVTQVAVAYPVQVQVEQTAPNPPVNLAPIPVSPEVALKNQLDSLEQKQKQLQQQLDALKQTGKNRQDAVVLDKQPQNLSVYAEGLFLKPNTTDLMDFAITDPGTALATSGDIERVKFDQANALRVGLNYRAPNSPWDIHGNYTTFRTEGENSATAPAGGFLFSTQSHPLQNHEAQTANADAKLKYDGGNLEVGHNLKLGKNAGLRLFGGLGVASVDRDMTVNYDGISYTQGQVKSSSSFTGVGPRLGVEGRLNLGSGFSVFGRGAGTLLVGSKRSTLRETDNNGADVVTDFDYKQRGEMVPALEAAIGVDWQKAISKNAKVGLSAGYEVQKLFNVTDSLRFSDDIRPGTLSRTNGDLSLNGFFVKGGVTVEF